MFGHFTTLCMKGLNNRFQRVLLNSDTSKKLPIKAGVPQGSIFGPRFFLFYINDLLDDILSTVKLFPDDTALFSVVHQTNTALFSVVHQTNTSVRELNVMRCAIWYHLYNLKNVKNIHGGMLILVKLQAEAKINTPPWVFFTFFNLYK